MVVGSSQNVQNFITQAGKISTDLFVESEDDVQSKNFLLPKLPLFIKP